MITPITKPRKPRKMLAYDFEWVPGSLDMRLCGVYDGERYKSFKTIKLFLNYLLSPRFRGYWFFAHAGGLADIQFVLEYLADSDYTANASFSGSAAIIVNVRKGNNVWHFGDSYWLLRESLAKVAKSIGMAKTGPAGEEAWTSEQRRHWYATAPMSELEPYNENDCVILYNALNQFEDALVELGGELKSTIASSAMTLFRRVYLKEEILTNDRSNDVSRKSYFASRVEVFQKKVEGEAYYYDINSSFPYAMLSPVPGDLLSVRNTLPDSALQATYGKSVLVDVLFELPDMHFPPTPTRYKGKVIFPTGQWRSWLTGVDLALMLREGGKILKVFEVLTFSEFDGLAAYATDLYNRRKATDDPVEKMTYKLLLNSLYGKFAETGDKQELLINPSKRDLKKLSIENMISPGIWLREHEVEVSHMHVPIATWITSRARKTLYDFMKESREFHYCDTDGFSTLDKYEESNELGGLKLEKIITKGEFEAPKVYRMEGLIKTPKGWEKDTLVKAKGFSLSKNTKEASQQFDDLKNGHPVHSERMVRIRENVRAGSFKPRERIISKRMQSMRLEKRYFYPNGQSRPWNYSELEAGLKKTKR